MAIDTASLLQLVQSGRNPDVPVCHTADGLVRWAGFAERIAARRRALRGEPRRLLMGDADPLDFAVTLLAALAEGHVPVIPPNFQAGTLAELPARLAGDPLPPEPTLELYTSGSSGEPKRVVKKLVQLEAECRALESLWGATIGDAAVVATVPHHHIYGLLFRLCWPLLAGRPFDTITAAEPTTLAERLAAFDATVLISSPAHLARLPELSELGRFCRPRLLFSSGGPLSAAVAACFQGAWGQAPTEVFGSTESGGIAWRRQAGQEAAAWAPLPGVAIGRDEDGALLVRSPFLADPQALRLEDAVECLDDGRFLLCGRLDRVVKIEEKRLSLPEMEARLAAHPLVREAAVVQVPTAGGRRTVVGALVVPSEAGQALLSNGRRHLTIPLAEHLAANYDRVLLPRRWRFAERLPVDERGKLPRAALAALFAGNPP